MLAGRFAFTRSYTILISSNDIYFTRLSAINVSDCAEKEGQFSSLSWPFAVSRLRQCYPMSTRNVKHGHMSREHKASPPVLDRAMVEDERNHNPRRTIER